MLDISAPTGDGRSPGRKGGGRRLILALVLVAVAAGVGVLAYHAGYFQTAGTGGGPKIMDATCASIAAGSTPVNNTNGGSGSHVYFLIVETDPPSPYAGINGSYYVPATQKWPVMHVQQGQVVSIRVLNCASNEPHGFQVSFYDPESKSLNAIQPGGSYDVTFTATTAGTFRVYCSIFCSIHPLMQNGELVVSS